MQTVTTIGLDIAKSVFQVHGIDAEGRVIIRRQLKRRYVLAFFQKLPPCLVGIEACATSHHFRSLNQYCAPDSYLESMLLTRFSKNVFRQHRPKADVQLFVQV
jgi:hypothetical protein